jgi:hypothetical protein
VGLEERHARPRWAHQRQRKIEQFTAKVINALRRLHKMPALVRVFFSNPDLCYIQSTNQDLLSMNATL